MKNIVIAILLSTVPLSLFAQTKTIDRFYKKYQTHEEATMLEMQGYALKLAADKAKETCAGKILQKISHLRVLSMEESNKVANKEIKQLMDSAKKNNFEDLMKIKDGTNMVEFLLRQENNYISNVLVVVNGPSEFVLLSIEGQLQFSDLNNLNLEVKGANHLNKLPENRKDIPKA